MASLCDDRPENGRPALPWQRQTGRFMTSARKWWIDSRERRKLWKFNKRTSSGKSFVSEHVRDVFRAKVVNLWFTDKERQRERER